MMLADARDGDVFDDNHLVVRVTRQRHDLLGRVLPHARGELGVKIGNTLGRLLQPVALGVLTDAFENESNAVGDLFRVNFTRTAFGHKNNEFSRFWPQSL
jgi:hypothetical protein